jgi:hypothetical protein
MERAGERRILNKHLAFLIPPHPTLSRWRGIVVLLAE